MVPEGKINKLHLNDFLGSFGVWRFMFVRIPPITLYVSYEIDINDTLNIMTAFQVHSSVLVFALLEPQSRHFLSASCLRAGDRYQRLSQAERGDH